MFVKRVLNNNSLVTVGKDGQEIILTGLGIGYCKKKGDRIPRERIDKCFALQTENDSSKVL
jgi:beta-glucoside operon transcriptional antiterminator